MKIEYHLTSHRVVHSHVKLYEHLSIDRMLEKMIWFPPVLRVHIDTKRCCTDPEFNLEPGCDLLDPRLLRFATLEQGLVKTVCFACGRVNQVAVNDNTLLHWRSSIEVKWWRGLPWFDTIMSCSSVTNESGTEVLWSMLPTTTRSTELLNTVPVQRTHVPDVQAVQGVLHQVVAQVRQCVHPRIYHVMQSLTSARYDDYKVYVVFRQRTREGYLFLTKKRKQCLSWPRGFVQGDDSYLVHPAARLGQPVFTLSDFMKSVIQVFITNHFEFVFVVNWSSSATTLPGHVWVQESDCAAVHGMINRQPWLQLALGITRRLLMYHGTTSDAAKQIKEKGFKVSSIHQCSGVYYKCDPPFACSCKGMLGPGVYLAEFDKAAANAGRVTPPGQVASVLECAVDVGECKFVSRQSLDFCDCGCGSTASDHVASWYHDQMFDSLYLCDGAGVKRAELCVRRPERVEVLKEHSVIYNELRERTFCSRIGK